MNAECRVSGGGENQGNVFIHLQPTAEELRGVYLEMAAADTLKYLPEFVRDMKAWMEYFLPKPKKPRAISFCPVVIEVDGRYPAMIYLTDWRERGQSAQVHFAAHAQYRPKTVFCACQLAIDMILRSKEVDLLDVCCTEDNVRSIKMAAAMGFIETARAAGCVHSSKTLKGEIYVIAESTKTKRSGKGGRSGYAGKCRCAGRRRSGASQTSAAEGKADHVPG
jgi:RimJ/RimL family protein N-acetyltransferase